MARDCTYFHSMITFCRLDGDENWSMDIRTYDGHNAKEVVRALGMGQLDEYVLSEHLDIFCAVTTSLAERVEGLAQRFRELT